MKWNQSKLVQLKKHLVEENKRDYPYKIPWKGGNKLESYDVYTVPISLLNYNFNNTRIRADLEAYLFSHKEKIDSENKIQQKTVQHILLNSEHIGEEATRVLEKDLKSKGQLDPAISTPDGTLIDGNRRLAILKKLHEETNQDKFSHMEICVLPETATEDDLKELEMRMQMSFQFKIPYGLINTALEFRELHSNLKWDYHKIELATNQHYKESEIKKMIEIINLIDEYLVELPPKGRNKKQYRLAEKGWESFKNLQSYLRWSKENSDNKTTTFRKRFGFQIIADSTSTFRDVRRFGYIIKDKELRRKLETVSDTLKGKNPSSYLNPINVKKEMINFRELKEAYKESKGDPKKIAQQAYKKLLRISPTGVKRGDAKLLSLLNEISYLINDLKKRI